MGEQDGGKRTRPCWYHLRQTHIGLRLIWTRQEVQSVFTRMVEDAKRQHAIDHLGYQCSQNEVWDAHDKVQAPLNERLQVGRTIVRHPNFSERAIECLVVLGLSREGMPPVFSCERQHGHDTAESSVVSTSN
jgi:hypothetical protein